jgi:RNA polymerase sigma-70 factor, ECF subfamily
MEKAILNNSRVRFDLKNSPIFDESELIRELQAGSEEAFETVVRLYGGRMLAIARRFLPVEQDARDVVQNALLSTFRSINKFAGQARLSTWLHRIVVNCALMELRSRKRRKEDSIEDLLPHFDDRGTWICSDGSNFSLESLFEERDVQTIVRRCIARLPTSYRNVLLLRDIEGRDSPEVELMLGVRSNAMKVRLHRARQALRGLLLEELRDKRDLPLGAIGS